MTGTPVAVNLLWCVPGDVGGSEEYLARQLLGLAEVQRSDPEFVITAYAPRGYAAAHPDIAVAARLVEAPGSLRRRPVRIAMEHSWLAARTRRAALVHHGGGTAPAVGRRPIVLTLHDLQFLDYPQYVHPLKLRYLRRAVRSSVRRASVVAVPSEFVRSTVLDAYGVDPKRVVVVPHGVEGDLGRDSTSEDELRTRYGLGEGPVLVYPAITHPHKNHRLLLEVLARLDPQVRLVLTGGRGLADDKVTMTVQRLGLGDRVVRTGRVSDPDRDGLIRLAEALVFPSEYEGFGAPPLEAMALGTPVVASDRASLPEVVGEGGLVVPLDADAWVEALQSVPARRSELADAGRRRAAELTAGRSAEALLTAYRLALA